MIEVHRHLGPGRLESAYEVCVAHELALRYRLDLVVVAEVVVEISCVERLLPIHAAQLLTLLRLTRLPVGLLGEG